MYQGEQLPLGIDLVGAAQGEAPQSLLRTDIGEYRFDHGHAVSVDFSAVRGVHAPLHPVGVGRLRASFDDERDLASVTLAGIC